MAKVKQQEVENIHDTLLTLANNGSEPKAIAMAVGIPLATLEFFLPLVRELAQMKNNPDRQTVRNKIVMNAVGWVMSDDPAIQLRGQQHLMKLWPEQYANIFKYLLNAPRSERVIVESKVVNVTPHGEQAAIIQEMQDAEEKKEQTVVNE